MNTNHSKQIQRSNYRHLRNKALPRVEALILNNVISKIESLIRVDALKGYLGIYWPLSGEVDLRGLKASLNIPIALPACREEGVITYHSWNKSPLKKDSQGIPAPLNEPILSAEDISLLLIPAIAIDQNGYRLGYGAGFFDRLRAKSNWRAISSFVVLPKACVSKLPLPKDKWDIPFDGWINEEGNFKSV